MKTIKDGKLLNNMEQGRKVQAHINNISFPKTLEEFQYFMRDSEHFNVEDILYSETVEWTVPKWAVEGDLVFFFHAKTAIQTIRKLTTELNLHKEEYDYELLAKNLVRARSLYNEYGGKIFAVGRVIGKPFFDDEDFGTKLHWGSKIYAEIGNIELLQQPIDISEFNSYILVSRQSAITPIFGTDFDKLQQIIIEKNTMSNYFKTASSNPLPLNKIDKNNFLEITSEYRRSFFLERQFRVFYVDYILSAIGDKKKIYSECTCFKNGRISGYADNAIYINDKYLFVEVKLNIDTEKDFIGQINQYCEVDNAIVEKDHYEDSSKLIQDKVLVIDIYRIGIFDKNTGSIDYITELDAIESMENLMTLKEKIHEKL